MQEHLPIIEGAAVRALSEGDKLAALKLFAAIGEIATVKDLHRPEELLSPPTRSFLGILEDLDGKG